MRDRYILFNGSQEMLAVAFVQSPPDPYMPARLSAVCVLEGYDRDTLAAHLVKIVTTHALREHRTLVSRPIPDLPDWLFDILSNEENRWIYKKDLDALVRDWQ